MWSKCEVNSSKESYIKRTNWSEFFCNSSNFSLHRHEFDQIKICQRTLKWTETVPRKPVLTKLYYMTQRKKTICSSTLTKLSFLTDLMSWHSQNQQLQYLSVYWHYILFWIFFLLSQLSNIRLFHFISF